jgi:hypothetical protein
MVKGEVKTRKQVREQRDKEEEYDEDGGEEIKFHGIIDESVIP